MAMSRIWIAITAAAILLAPVSVSRGQVPEDPNAGDTASQGEKAEDMDFLFNRRIIDLIAHRVTDEMGKHYNFDPAQQEAVRTLVSDRFPQWFMENKKEIVHLSNQYVEALLGDEPPKPENVAKWASQAAPLINEFAENIRATTDDMRPYLDEAQQIQLDQELAAFEVGMGYMNRRMQNWAAGGYDPVTEFPGSVEFQDEERQRVAQLRSEQEAARRAVIADIEQGLAPDPQQAAADAMANGGTQPAPRTAAATRDDWAAYVESFIARYKLNESQQNQAYAQLQKYQKLRDLYLERKFDQLKELQKLLANATTDEDRQRVKKRYDALNEPVDRYFTRLKSQLERLPTRRQRELAEPARTEAGPRALAETDKSAAAIK